VIELGRDRYRTKAKALLESLNCIGVALPSLLARYEGVNLADSTLDKGWVFSQVVGCEIDLETHAYLEGKCGSLGHHRDGRTGAEYAADLIYGWLIEDAVLARIQRSDSGAILSGHDRFREFLPAGKISAQPDIKVRFKGEDRLLEVFADWTGYWRKRGEIDLRDAKYDRLMLEGALMLGIAPSTTEGFLLDFKTDRLSFSPAPNPRYGGKWAYRSDEIRDWLRPLDVTLDALAAGIGDGGTS
jgi:hypothetical protein